MAAAAEVLQRFRASLRTRAALGLGPATSPLSVLLPLGLLVGPAGVRLVTADVIAHLSVVVSIALATLGVFAGIALGTSRAASRRLVAASLTQAAVTMAAVTGATYVLLLAWTMPTATPPLLLAAMLGAAAAASAAPSGSDDDHTVTQIAGRVADLDDVLPIAAGAVVLSLAVTGVERMMLDVVLTMVVGVAVGLAGWLLFERSEGAERGVFVLGTLALLGGSAAYLGTSPLLAGVVTGLIWARTPGHTDRIAAADLRKVQHPLVVLLVLVAGAGLPLNLAGVWLLAPYVLFRMSGKLLGGWIASRVAREVAPVALGAYLMAPGVLGIAIALNLQQVAPDMAGPVVLAVASGAVVSELVALFVIPAPRVA